MKKIYFVLPLICALFLIAFLPLEKPMDELSIGAKAPMADVEVTDVSGEKLTLNDVARKNGLLVNFSCNTCPWVEAWEDRYNPIAKLAKENGIGIIALNPNAGYRNKGESLKDMKERANQSDYQFYYALDKGAKIAKVFGATRTPHIFLFNSDMELVYRGAIDDNAKNADKVEQPYLKNAIKDLVMGNQINPQTTKSLGCTIKWPR
ncbi:redoxin domain-containing protein [Fodinibius halophilus]|uniref:Redoxin domain-containing protein n=1 Tax=Fodinibius halophilus TaxID=1736908 RepID=A0A6M1TNB1_9BACT|nr:redoxin domain-containing protein [Fodinibius halophilus]NGP89850.1 redoxin domain-containing protein [Fodinibius halophilus]